MALYDQSRELERMVAQRNAELVATRQQLIRRLGRAAEFKDHETGNQVVRICQICRLIGVEAGLRFGISILPMSCSAAGAVVRRYPLGFRGDQIPLYGRIAAIADVFDALMTRHCYREAFTAEQAVEMMVAARGTHFEPQLLDCFMTRRHAALQIMAPYADEGGMQGT